MYPTKKGQKFLFQNEIYTVNFFYGSNGVLFDTHEEAKKSNPNDASICIRSEESQKGGIADTDCNLIQTKQRLSHKNNVERFDYRLIVTDLNNPSPRSGGAKITNYNEMIKGETYGYNAMVDWCSKMNKDYPTFSHSVQKWSDYEAHEKYMGRL